MRSRYPTLAFLLVLALTGCDSGGNDEPPAVQGRFEGIFVYTVEDGIFQETWMLTLSEQGPGQISGAGNLGDMTVTVDGTHDHPDVTLRFFDKFDSFAGAFTGTLTDDGAVLEGVFNFSIFFIEVPVKLRRQQP